MYESNENLSIGSKSDVVGFTILRVSLMRFSFLTSFFYGLVFLASIIMASMSPSSDPENWGLVYYYLTIIIAGLINNIVILSFFFPYQITKLRTRLLLIFLTTFFYVTFVTLIWIIIAFIIPNIGHSHTGILKFIDQSLYLIFILSANALIAFLIIPCSFLSSKLLKMVKKNNLIIIKTYGGVTLILAFISLLFLPLVTHMLADQGLVSTKPGGIGTYEISAAMPFVLFVIFTIMFFISVKKHIEYHP